jgi:exonuclease SbcC
MKFKSVDIVGFRAYAENGDGAFDFTNSDGKVSNFISIYAPNGFGKSSFYDAVEWAITNNISRYIRDSQRINNDSASLYLNTSESSQRILKNRYIDEKAPSYVKVCTTGKKDFDRQVRRPAAGQRDYTYDTARTDKTTKHLTDIFLSQDAIDAFLKEDRPEQRYDRFMGAFGGNDEKYRSSLFTSIKSCSRELKLLSDTISSLEENLREPTLEFSVDEVNQTISEINLKGGSFPKIGNTFSELEQTELLSMLSKRVIELNTELESLGQQRQAIDYCVGNLPHLTQYREHRAKLKYDLAKINSNRDDINSLFKSIDTKNNLEQRLRSIVDEAQIISLILSNQQQLNKIVEDISNHKKNISAIDKELANTSISNSANTQTVESLRRERINNDTQMASLLDDLSKVEALFVEIDVRDKLIHALNSKITESERRTTTAHALKKSLQDELLKYTNLAVGKSIISEDAQALLKPDPEFLINYHQKLELRNDIQERIQTLDVNAKDLSGQSADLFSLISMAKTFLSKKLSDTCPVCNAQYESHTALLEKIQSNGSIEAAIHSLLMSRADLEKKIVQIDDFLDRGHIYLTSLKTATITNINERLSNVESEVARLDRELADVKYELAVKTDNMHRLRAGARNLSKDDYIKFINDAISSVKADIVKIDNSIEGLVTSIKSANDAADKIASKRAEALTKLEVIEQNDIYITYKDLKTKYILPEGGILDLFSPIYDKLTETKISLHREITATSETITKLQDTLSQPGGYSSELPLIERMVSLTEELRQIEDATTRIEAFLIPLVNDFSAPSESLLNELQIIKADLDKKTTMASSSLMLTNILQTQIEYVLPFFRYRELRTKIDSHRDTKNQIENLSISLSRELKKVEIKLKERIDNFFYTDLITSIYRKIDPHPFFKIVRFECVFPIEDKPRLEIYLYEDEFSQPISPALYFSSAQLNILSLSIFLAKALHIEHDGDPVRAILIDDPIHSMDSINVLSVIDLLRNISVKFDRQIILSTHDENFYELIKLKVPEEQFGSKFIKFKSFGVVHADSNND